MNLILKFVCIVSLLLFLFSFLPDTFAYFTDVGYAQNTFKSGVWIDESESPREANFLNIVNKNSKLTGNGEKLHGITLVNVNKTQSITIDKIQVLWNISSGQSTNLNITEIKIKGHDFYNVGSNFKNVKKTVGNSFSRENYVLIDGENDVFRANEKQEIEFWFDDNVSSLTPFTIYFIMEDGSEKGFVTDPNIISDNLNPNGPNNPNSNWPNNPNPSGPDNPNYYYSNYYQISGLNQTTDSYNITADSYNISNSNNL